MSITFNARWRRSRFHRISRGHDPEIEPPESERARYRDQFAERFLSADFLFSIYFKAT